MEDFMLSFEDGEILDLARELAALSGETLISAIRTALEERLGRERMLRSADRGLADRIDHLDDALAPLTIEMV
jgi:antitoxin VapB